MIKLSQIMPIQNPRDYKIHVAKSNGRTQPLDEYVENFDYWMGWNSYRKENGRNRFTRKYVISFMDFYPQKGCFLFGGIFEILNTYSDHYDIKLCDEYKEFIGRLKVTNIKTTRGSAFNFESLYSDIQVVELLDKPYKVLAFPGYGNIDFDFKIIKRIIDNQTLDWKSALVNIKGIYMLTNKKNGKRYIGSAYGDQGIWSRWSDYCTSGHGGDVQLVELVKEKGYEYIENNFKVTLLEIHSMYEIDKFIIEREQYWKRVMMCDNKLYSYNSN